MDDTQDSEHAEPHEMPGMADLPELELEESATHVKKGAYWFYAIAVLSIITIFVETKSTRIVAGLAFPSIIDGFLAGDWRTGDPNYFVQLAGAAIFIFFGYFGAQLQRWAFIAGAILYLLDAALYALLGEWLALFFHLFVLFRLFFGLRTIVEYEAATKK